MAAALALWLVNLLLDAQTARNSLFPEAADTPIIAVGFLAMSAALDHILLYENCPLRGLCPRLVPLESALGPALCDACGALAEGDATWISGEEYPTQAALDRDLEALRIKLANAVTQTVTWRLTLARAEGIRYDRFQHVVIMSIDDLSYHDMFPPLQTIRSCFSRLQIAMQQGIVDQTRTLRGTAPVELEHSQ